MLLMNERCRIAVLSSGDPRVSVGRFTYGTPVLKLWNDAERIVIGAFCSIADEVTIFGGGEHQTGWVTTYPLRIALGDPMAGRDGHPTSKGPTLIGNDVWLGHGATILSGVRIGDGAVIGAGAVVARDVPPYQMVAGNPAGVVRGRFTPDQVDALLQIAWWRWPLDRIEAALPALCGGPIDDFIQRYRVPSASAEAMGAADQGQTS